jgi:hypothetical protein
LGGSDDCGALEFVEFLLRSQQTVGRGRPISDRKDKPTIKGMKQNLAAD